MFAPSLREASPLTSPRAGMAHSWNTAEAALEREAEVIVRSTDAQLASLREAALSLSLERRRDRGGSIGGSPVEAPPPEPTQPLVVQPPPPSPWDALCSPRSAPQFETGTRVSLQDSFQPHGAPEGVTIWWDGTVTGRATSGRTDYLGRPVYRVLFDDLEIQYTGGDGERAVHTEEGGPHEVVFVSDAIAFDCDSGEELPYRRSRPSECTGQQLLGAQIVSLP